MGFQNLIHLVYSTANTNLKKKDSLEDFFADLGDVKLKSSEVKQLAKTAEKPKQLSNEKSSSVAQKSVGPPTAKPPELPKNDDLNELLRQRPKIERDPAELDEVVKAVEEVSNKEPEMKVIVPTQDFLAEVWINLLYLK